MKKNNERAKRDIPLGLRRVGKATGIAVLVLMLLILAFNAALTVQKYTRPGKTPSILGISPVFVMSGSMEPTLLLDDLAFIRRINPDKLKERDIIAFKPVDSRYLVTHRIVGVGEDPDGKRIFNTMGDNNDAEDKATIHDGQVVGLYFARIPRLGKVLEWAVVRPSGVYISMAAPLILFMLIDIIRRIVAWINRKLSEKFGEDKKKRKDRMFDMLAEWAEAEESAEGAQAQEPPVSDEATGDEED